MVDESVSHQDQSEDDEESEKDDERDVKSDVGVTNPGGYRSENRNEDDS